MRQALSKLPLLAMKKLPATPAYGPALWAFGRIRSGGSMGEPIVFLGDSLTSGAGLPFPAAYPALVSERLGHRRFVNLGVGGETSRDIRQRFLRMPEFFGHPIVIWAGRNNYSDGWSVAWDIEAVLEAAETQRYLVLAVPAGDYPSEQPGEPARQDLAELNAVLEFRFGRHFLNPNSDIGRSDRLDAIHLNRDGHRKIAARVADAIRAAGW
ncbi:hypothetical protein C3941_24040 [Kaistia algarum]|uniref:SGNH/GDSL hydrolase family protein n=1 Tax=Kaistia algarum TaxID=2083279 RepID=UPI000CE83D35|nr:GDSL-type esterase/lipase family protein [Kaistia algarum]MCX5514247.1 GDSL-type esterase/lipase family protein [Kaistia algarum]PPE77366.1 hypothetical protein C3941_24040 [Kaistia algarum]